MLGVLCNMSTAVGSHLSSSENGKSKVLKLVTIRS